MVHRDHADREDSHALADRVDRPTPDCQAYKHGSVGRAADIHASRRKPGRCLKSGLKHGTSSGRRHGATENHPFAGAFPGSSFDPSHARSEDSTSGMNVSDDKTASVSPAAYLRQSLRRKEKHSSRQLEEVVAGAAIGEGVSLSHLASVVGWTHLPQGRGSISRQKLCRKAEEKAAAGSHAKRTGESRSVSALRGLSSFASLERGLHGRWSVGGVHGRNRRAHRPH